MHIADIPEWPESCTFSNGSMCGFRSITTNKLAYWALVPQEQIPYYTEGTYYGELQKLTKVQVFPVDCLSPDTEIY